MPHKRFAAFLALALFAVPALAAVTGSVMTADGKPIAGARVSTYANESAQTRRTRLLSDQPEAVPLASTQTDAKGAFTLESPKTPVVELRVSLRGYEPASRTIERDEEGTVIVLTKAETRTGVVTSSGKPVAGATVVLSYMSVEYVAKTNEKGEYEAPDPKHVGSITVLHRDYAKDSESFVGVGMNNSVPPSKLNRTLTKGTPLTGRVTLADGKTAVAGAAITLDGWPLATSGEDGSFTIARVPAKWDVLVARKDALIGQRMWTKDAAASMTLKLDKGATFSGRVLDAKTKLPVAGATVRLAGRRFEMRNSDGGMSAEVDAKGMYSIVAAPGTYSVMVFHPAYDSDSGESGAAAGQQGSRDFSLQPLARVTGVVVDEANKPVAAATIVPEATGDPFQMIRGGRMMRDFAQTTSGPDGKFILRYSGDREVKMRASKKALPTGRSDTMKLAPGERRSGVVIALPSGIEVTGKVTDGEGKALSGATISAAETQGRGGNANRMMFMLGGASRDEDLVTTASDGTFSMRLKEGAYDFTIRRDGYSSKTIRAHSVAVTGTEPVEAKLDPAVEIIGRVTRNGVGIEGVTVFPMMNGSDSSATTGPDGSFRLGNLSPGQVGAMFMKMGDFINEQRMLTAPSQDVVIELPAGVRVSGRVLEKGTRRPITSFEAGVTRSRSGGPMVMMGPPQTQAFTSDDGSFVLENVPAGASTLTANAPGYVSARLNVTIEDGKPLEDVVLELDAGVKLTGKVTGPNGQGLSDVTVRVAPSTAGNFALGGGDKRGTTDANGEYSIDALTAGEETISFSHPKYLATSKQVTLKGRETRLDAQLEAGARFAGMVVTEAGVPVADATVRAMAGGMGDSVVTNANGQFEFESLAAGRYRFTATHTGYADGVVDDYDVSSGGQLRITLKTGGTIYGRVTGFSEQELGNAYVTASSRGSYTQTPIDSSGNYRIEGAPVGSVSVQANVRSLPTMRSTPSQTVTVEAGSSVQVDLAFRSDVTIRGRVMRNRQPLANGTIMFSPRSRSGTASNAVLDSQGNYSIAGLDDGNYYVTVADMQRGSTYSTQYEVKGSGTFDIDFTTAGLRGRVVDSGNNRPLSGVNINVRAAQVELFRARSTVTDENGVFAMDSVPSGSYTITASADTYGSDSKSIVVGDSGTEEVELRLAKSDGISLNVVDGRDGRALAANATLFDAGGNVVQEKGGGVFFGPEPTAGTLTLPVSPGQYMATVSAFNYAPVHVSVSAPSTRQIALTPGGRIDIDSKHTEPRRVQLLDQYNLIYPRLSVIPRRYEITPNISTPLEHIAPGTYWLQLLGPDEVTVVDQVRVVVTEGQTVRAEI